MSHNHHTRSSRIKIAKIFPPIYDATQTTSFIDEDIDLDNSYASKQINNHQPQGLSTSLSSGFHKITDNIMSKLSPSSSSLPLHHNAISNLSIDRKYPYSLDENCEIVIPIKTLSPTQTVWKKKSDIATGWKYWLTVLLVILIILGVFSYRVWIFGEHLKILQP
ncbi:3761_t:CDS:2 [Acaulospora morrowiae]|uniref:3761_t:CDS:1 n=1 Tax=Acaulospora morrowiae TaxID=94023 RepID=A0A9N9G7K3_9GLOM|nr:3761_t:CDS:2 [Acaulospora morrowiae]